MRSATIRRFALVAALVLLAPAWCRPTAVPSVLADTTGALIVGLASPSGTAGTAIRRHPGLGWWLGAGTHQRGIVVVAVLALALLLRTAPWSTLQALRAAPSSITRRRHVISLRAPPPLRCA